jgi:hypothetical protein
MQLLAVCGELSQHPAAGGEDGRAGGGFKRFIQMAIHGLPRLQQIVALQVNVIEEVGDVALRQSGIRDNRSGLRRLPGGCGRLGLDRRHVALLDRKLGDDLQLAFVKKLKVFLP